MLERSDKYFKAIIMKILHQVIMNTVKMHTNVDNLSK